MFWVFSETAEVAYRSADQYTSVATGKYKVICKLHLTIDCTLDLVSKVTTYFMAL